MKNLFAWRTQSSGHLNEKKSDQKDIYICTSTADSFAAMKTFNIVKLDASKNNFKTNRIKQT